MSTNKVLTMWDDQVERLTVIRGDEFTLCVVPVVEDRPSTLRDAGLLLANHDELVAFLEQVSA